MAKTSRIEFVDRLRGAAVLAMFFVHTAGAWLEPSVRDGAWWKWSMRVSGMVAPVFVFLVGVSVSLVAQATLKRGTEPLKVQRSLFLRGLKIVLLGYGLHVLFFALGSFNGPWTKMLKVDILHAIGLSLAILPLIAWPVSRLNLKALLLCLLIPVLGLVNYCLPLENWLPQGLEAYVSTRPKLALFPFIPYATWAALGLFVGPLWAAGVDSKKKQNRFWRLLVFSSIGVYVVGVGLKSVYYGFGVNEIGRLETATHGLVHVFFTKTAFVLIIFAAFGVTAPLFDRMKFKPMVLFGRTSLFCYSVHLLIIYHLGGSSFVRSLSPAGQALGAAVLTIVMYGLAYLWNQRFKLRDHLRRDK